MASKRKSLCVDEKVCVIRAIEKGEKKSDVGRRFELSHSTVATIWKNKETILQAALEGKSRKKLRKPKFEELDQAMLSWFNNQRQNNVSISGPIVKAKAEKFAEQLGVIDFKASEGWLGKFKHRHKITFGKMNGEARDVDMNVTRRTEAQLKKWSVNHKTRKTFLARLKKKRSQTEAESTNFQSEISDPVIEDAENPLANEVKLKVDSDSEPDETPDDVLEVLPPGMVQEQMALAHNIKNEPSHSSGPSPSFGENDHVETEDLQQVNSKRIEEREEELHRLQVAEGEWLVKAAKEAYLKAKLERESAEELIRFRKTKREEAESKMNKD